MGMGMLSGLQLSIAFDRSGSQLGGVNVRVLGHCSNAFPSLISLPHYFLPPFLDFPPPFRSLLSVYGFTSTPPPPSLALGLKALYVKLELELCGLLSTVLYGTEATAIKKIC
jgi:hypothetical protein